MVKRWVLNILLLAFVGLVFLGTTSLVNVFVTSSEAQQHEYSHGRRLADELLEEEEYLRAAEVYRQLAEADDFNCLAHFKYARCLVYEIEDRLQDSEFKAEEKTYERLRNLLTDDVQVAIQAFEEVLPFTQFRNIARIRLGLLYGFVGEREKAIEICELARSDGMRISNSLKIFQLYHCESVYSHLVPSEEPEEPEEPENEAEAEGTSEDVDSAGGDARGDAEEAEAKADDADDTY